MDDYTEPRPHRPQITLEAVLLAVGLGANCPCKLARVFDVHMLNPDLVHACTDLVKLRLVEVLAMKHTGPTGLTCTVVAIPKPRAGAGQ